MRPPCRPAPGPRSTSQSAWRMIVSSCSTTTTVLPRDLQIAQGVDQPLVVAGMQADRRLVEHVADADQAGAQAGGQPHALQLAAAEACRPGGRA